MKTSPPDLKKISDLKNSYQIFMHEAIKQAKKSIKFSEIPIGAVIINDKNQIVSMSYNKVEANKNACMHAEINAINEACHKLNTKYLNDCSIYITLEPCPMCAAALSLVKIKNIIFGAYDIKSGGIDHGPRIFESSSCHHKPNIVGGILEKDCSELITNFFKQLRR